MNKIVIKSLPLARRIASASCLLSHQSSPKIIRLLSSQVKKNGEVVKENPQFWSFLFSKTATTDQVVLKAEQEQRKQEEEEEKKGQDKQWKPKKLGFYLFGIGGVGLGLCTMYELAQPEKDAEERDIEDEFSHLPSFEQSKRRLFASFSYYQKLIQEPSYAKLLPAPLQPPYSQPKYTLVLEMEDVLVHREWTYQTGWRFKKRPGVDEFLEQLGRIFEVVVYTADHGMTLFAVLDKLDPRGFIAYRLARDATHFVDGHHVKSLDRLNRDLSKVVVIDWNPDSTKFHPENAFNIPRWTGNDDDITLFDLTAFLKTLVAADVDDVREVMRYYQQFPDPIEKFRENRSVLLEQLEGKQREGTQTTPSFVDKWSPNFLGHK